MLCGRGQWVNFRAPGIHREVREIRELDFREIRELDFSSDSLISL